ncbi:hypothetical protein ABK730_14890 [Klebsiella indica]|uniref:Secreted protein n=1 Tax=Klebsiella indica TaxID=2582917 RepID=A0A5R9LDA0_9ENTR|nr:MULTISPECIES: hypothetical protein [Klebsiella]TLV11528.1 hypothetical protein FE839_18220 [Klebsiella indica]
MNYKNVLKTAFLFAPVALLILQTSARAAEVTKTSTCQKASPVVDKDGVPLPPIVEGESTHRLPAHDTSGYGGATVNCQPAAIKN